MRQVVIAELRRAACDGFPGSKRILSTASIEIRIVDWASRARRVRSGASAEWVFAVLDCLRATHLSTHGGLLAALAGVALRLG